MGTCCEFGHGERGHGNLGWEHAHVDGAKVDDDGRVEHARSTRWSATGFDALVGDSVEISSELFAVDGRSGLEELNNGLCSHEAKKTQRSEFADGDTVACHHEGLALVEAAHDLPAAVPEFSLSHDLLHPLDSVRRGTETSRSIASILIEVDRAEPLHNARSVNRSTPVPRAASRPNRDAR